MGLLRRIQLPNSPTSAHLLAALVLMSALFAVEWITRLQINELQARARADAVTFASGLRARIDRELNAILFLSSGLASYLVVRASDLDDTEVQAILAELYNKTRHVRNFGVAVGYRLTYVHPYESNQAAIGLYYPDQPDQWPHIARAIESGTGTLAGPLDLVQGGRGLVYRVPVVRDGEYWGLLSTVIDIESLLEAVIPDRDTGLFEVAIRGTDGQGHRGDVFLGNALLFQDPEAITLAADIPNGQWVFAVKPLQDVSESSQLLLLRAMGWVVALLVGFSALITLRHRVQLAQLALFDPLTNLPNRRRLEDALEAKVSASESSQSKPCAVLFIDLDGFKAINDTWGHRAGDTILRTVATRIGEVVRAGDIVARWGGDEIVIVVEDPDAIPMDALKERLRQIIEEPIPYDGQSLRVGASIGSARQPVDGHSARELLKLADERMYAEKQKRRAAPSSPG